MTRPITARIDLSALQHNYQLAKQASQGPCLAVIKANAYGHGAEQCAKALEPIAEGFAISSLAEAKALRVSGITKPILLLEGIFEAAELAEAAQLNCWLVLHEQWQVDCLLAANLAHDWHVWLKVDTGMHRLGFSTQAALNAYQRLSMQANVKAIKLMTHFANADDLNSEQTQTQIQAFEKLVDQAGFEGDVSFANSAAILSGLNLRCNLTQWARPGLMLYGANPFYASAQPKLSDSLRAVMTISANIIAVRKLKAGERIGYGSLFQAKNAMRIGVVACGYADGYPRTAMGAPAMVEGKHTTVIGRVSMDMLFVDLHDIPTAQLGSEVELWGPNVAVSAVAAAANTLAYELFCNVKRVKFIYT